jgi:hypothetical protein
MLFTSFFWQTSNIVFIIVPMAFIKEELMSPMFTRIAVCVVWVFTADVLVRSFEKLSTVLTFIHSDGL